MTKGSHIARNKDKPTPTIEPRGLTQQQAAAHCGSPRHERRGAVQGRSRSRTL
jgi:hypothetical protein